MWIFRNRTKAKETAGSEPPLPGPGSGTADDERLTPDVRSVLSVPGALAARKARGGTAPERVAEQMTALKDVATAHADWVASSPLAAAL